MYQVYERADDCPPVEEFIWRQVCTEYGDFAGVKSLNIPDLLMLRALIDHQLSTQPISDSVYGCVRGLNGKLGLPYWVGR